MPGYLFNSLPTSAAASAGQHPERDADKEHRSAATSVMAHFELCVSPQPAPKAVVLLSVELCCSSSDCGSDHCHRGCCSRTLVGQAAQINLFPHEESSVPIVPSD